VNSEKNVFLCHGCLRGGDVIELARLAWDYPKEEAHVAAGYLLIRLVWIPWLRTLPESVRDEAKRSAWEGSRKIARMLYDSRGAA
jgi:hypothetical protein